MIYYFTPYSLTKNLGEEYNRYMDIIGDNDTAVFTDGDTCWLTPDYGVHIAEYVKLFPDAVLTCWVSRINEKAEQQSKAYWEQKPIRESFNMRDHLEAAISYKEGLYKVTPLHGFVSGTCMVIHKKIWQQHKFPEKQMFEGRGPNNMLGVDNYFTNQVRAAGIPVLRMDGIYLYHTYRLLTGDHDKTHLM